jgi:S1-C subfamily serine protease
MKLDLMVMLNPEQNMPLDTHRSSFAIECAPLRAFVHEFIDPFRQSTAGLKQLLGDQAAADAYFKGRDLQTANPIETVSGAAGSLLGNAAMFLGTSAVVRMVPGVGKWAPIVAGAALGFFQPLKPDQPSYNRFARAGLGAATLGLIEFGPEAMTRIGLGGKLLTSKFTMLAAAGALNCEGESILNTGHGADIAEVAGSGLAWAVTGHAINKADKLFRNSVIFYGDNLELSSLGRRYALATRIDSLLAGGKAAAESEIRMPSFTVDIQNDKPNPLPRVVGIDSEEAALYENHKGAVVRIRCNDGHRGSGFIVDQSGIIITADHVARPDGKMPKLKVDLADGTTMPARFVAAISDADLAVLKIEAQGLPSLTLGSSVGMPDQQSLFLLGHPAGASQIFITQGKYQARNLVPAGSLTARELGGRTSHEARWVVTDVPCYKGNSGGPILTPDGKVIGVLTQGIFGTSDGVGPAIEQLKPLIELLHTKV